MVKSFANTNNSSNLALVNTYCEKFQLEHTGIYGASKPKGRRTYSRNSVDTPTGAAFVKLFNMSIKEFCSKGNTSTPTSTYAHDTGIYQFIDFVDVKDVKSTLLLFLVQYFQHQDLDGNICPEHQQKVLWHFQLLSELLDGLQELQNKIYAAD